MLLPRPCSCQTWTCPNNSWKKLLFNAACKRAAPHSSPVGGGTTQGPSTMPAPWSRSSLSDSLVRLPTFCHLQPHSGLPLCFGTIVVINQYETYCRPPLQLDKATSRLVWKAKSSCARPHEHGLARAPWRPLHSRLLVCIRGFLVYGTCMHNFYHAQSSHRTPTCEDVVWWSRPQRSATALRHSLHLNVTLIKASLDSMKCWQTDLSYKNLFMFRLWSRHEGGPLVVVCGISYKSSPCLPSWCDFGGVFISCCLLVMLLV